MKKEELLRNTKIYRNKINKIFNTFKRSMEIQVTEEMIRDSLGAKFGI